MHQITESNNRSSEKHWSHLHVKEIFCLEDQWYDCSALMLPSLAPCCLMIWADFTRISCSVEYNSSLLYKFQQLKLEQTVAKILNTKDPFVQVLRRLIFKWGGSNTGLLSQRGKKSKKYPFWQKLSLHQTW